MKMKKIGASLALLMLLAGTAGLSACKDDPAPEDPTNDNGGNENNNNNNNNNNNDTPSTPDPDADKIKIGTKEEFIKMLKAELETVGEDKALIETYILTADIDFEGVDLGEELGQTAYSFQGTLDGRGHTISNLTLIRQKKQVGLFEGIYGGIIKNVNFKDVEVSNAVVDTGTGEVDLAADARGVSLFGNYAAGGAELTNIAIDGFKVYTNPEATGKVEEAGGLFVNAFDTVYLDNIAVTGLDATLGKNSGALIGSMRKTTDGLKVGGVSPSTVSACVIKANNILIEGSVKGTTSDSQGLGCFIGRCDNAEEGQALEVNGFVFKGSVLGTKNNGCLIGNAKAAGTKVVVKNAYILDADLASNGSLQTSANIFSGQFKSEDATFEDCYYVDRAVTVRKVDAENNTTTINYLDPEVAAPIKAADIETITDAFTVAEGKITLNGLSVEIPTDVQTTDVAAPDVAIGDGLTVTPVDQTTITVSGEVKWYHANNPEGPGANGNYIPVTIDAADGVDTTGAYYVDLNNKQAHYENGGLITIFVPVAEVEDGQSRADVQVLIRWNNTANDQVYTLKFGDVTLEAAPEYGAISQEDASLTAANVENTVEGVTTTDYYSLKYTAGTIAYDEVNKGNFITVKVAQPTWISEATLENVKVSGAAEKVSLDAGVLTLKVKVAAAGTEFTVQWSDVTDANTYKLLFTEAVVFGKTTANTEIKTFSLVATDLTAQTTSTTNITGGTDNFFTITGKDGKPVYIDGNPQRVNLKGGVKVDQCSIGITVTGQVTVKMNAYTSAADRTIKVLDANGDEVTTTVSSTNLTAEGGTDVTFTLGTAGVTNTYYIGVKTGGMYVYSISVDMEVEVEQ